jgi:hypothetical protein
MYAAVHRGQLVAWVRDWQNGGWPLELGLERSSSWVRPWRRRPRTAPFRHAFRAKFKPRGNIWTCVLPLPRSMLRKKLLPSHRCRAAAVLASRNRSGCRRWGTQLRSPILAAYQRPPLLRLQSLLILRQNPAVAGSSTHSCDRLTSRSNRSPKKTRAFQHKGSANVAPEHALGILRSFSSRRLADQHYHSF